MEDKYLTDSVFVRNNQMYYENVDSQIKIKSHNWHRYLSEIGWTKLQKQWIRKLNSYLDKPKNNSLFGTLDCGGEGNCLFHCLSFALDNGTNYQDIRNLLSKQITLEKYQELISIYRIIDESGEFEESWDPHTITYDDFKELIIRGGNEYWGDSLLLNLLHQTLSINIFVLYSNEINQEYYHYPLMVPYDETKETIILLYENEMHFQVVGYFKEGLMVYKFKDYEIPLEIRRLVKLR